MRILWPRGRCPTRSLRRRAAGVVLALVAVGCAGEPSGPVRWEPGAGAAATVRVVVAPSNLAVQMPPDVDLFVEPVERELIRHFQARGARLAVIFEPDAWALWRDSTAALLTSEPGEVGLDAAAAAFAVALRPHADYDLLVLPSLVFREARVVGRLVEWDGVRRRLAVRPAEVPTIEGYTTGWEGRFTGLSLHVMLLTPEGSRVFQGWGGIDVVHEAIVSRGESRGDPALLPDGEATPDAERVAQAVSLALEPYTLPSPKGSRGLFGRRAPVGATP
jgi:hypothetical protein